MSICLSHCPGWLRSSTRCIHRRQLSICLSHCLGWLRSSTRCIHRRQLSICLSHCLGWLRSSTRCIHRRHTHLCSSHCLGLSIHLQLRFRRYRAFSNSTSHCQVHLFRTNSQYLRRNICPLTHCIH